MPFVLPGSSLNWDKRKDRRGQTLFLDTRKMGMMIDRVHRELSGKNLRTIADTYHAWQGHRYSPPKLEPDTKKGHALKPSPMSPDFARERPWRRFATTAIA